MLDDNSTDRTAELVEGMAAKDDRIRLIKGEPLPEGWAGKPFACYQLAEKARGSWLLFIDADTTHAPHMLRSTLALALELKPSLLSGFPRQMAESLPEKIAMPLMYFVIMSWLPLWWLHRSKEPRPSLAIGQFLLFPREDYWRIGGHMAVKDRILEDVWLGVETVRHGGRHIAIDLSTVFYCRMYRDVGAMWEGFVKWIYSVAALSPAAIVGLLAAGFRFLSGSVLLAVEWLFVSGGSHRLAIHCCFPSSHDYIYALAGGPSFQAVTSFDFLTSARFFVPFCGWPLWRLAGSSWARCPLEGTTVRRDVRREVKIKANPANRLSSAQ